MSERGSEDKMLGVAKKNLSEGRVCRRGLKKDKMPGGRKKI